VRGRRDPVDNCRRRHGRDNCRRVLQHLSRAFTLAKSRASLDWKLAIASDIARTIVLSAIVESYGPTPVPLVVEGSRYGSPGGQVWGAGAAALATKLQ
jgi:hypothetical protein